MDADRLSFLYGADVVGEDWDLDDLDVRSMLLERTFDRGTGAAQLFGREIVANQIFADDPPEVWSAAERLRAEGYDREAVFRQLTLAFAPVMKAAIAGEEHFDRETYAAALSGLPFPSIDEVERAMIDVVRSAQGIVADEVVDATLDRLGRDDDDEVVVQMVEEAMDHLVDELGPLAWVAGDRTVHVAALTTGIVLTHRLAEDERERGYLDASFDLSGFRRVEGLTLATGEAIRASWAPDAREVWTGPDGWLEAFSVGSVIAVEVAPDAVVRLVELPSDPSADEAVVTRLRGAYDTDVDEPWLPISGEDLVLSMLLDEPTSFREPVAPLTELSVAAGLERRGRQVAHDATVWHNEVRARRAWRVLDAMGPGRNRSRSVLRALDVADLVSGVDMSDVPDVDGPADTAMLREVLGDLRDERVLTAVADELLDGDEPGSRARADAFVGALLAAASRPHDLGVARLLAALHAERSLEVTVAEQHLHLARQADPGFAAVTDRLAWYASDRGDAARALRLWRELEPGPAIDQDRDEVEQFASRQDRDLGRNEPCWCGSGRKHKHCHLGSTELPPLSDRVGWLCRKAVAFLARRGAAARTDVVEIVYARAVDPDDHDSVVAAFDDPIVMDLVLTEGGWFETFLDERGALLPEDEALLARAWVLVERTVYEVLEVRPGEGLVLRDLRTGDRVEVRERTFSRETRTGALVCARAVPDGQSHQLVGGVFPVAPGRESHLLDLLDDGDPEPIARWVASLYRPPVLRTREGETTVECELVIDLDDPDRARAFLDATYERDERDGLDAWVEMFPIDEVERIVRARLTLEGSRLTIATNSDERADRVVSTVLASFPDARVLADRRAPLEVAAMLRRQGLESEEVPDAELALDTPELVAALDEIRDRFERRWCDESILALSGLTPRQAAADPTRRDELIRLVASFEQPVPAAAVTMRPERLRELLDL